MIHLGSRVSALVDGRLSAAEEERAWSHVHTCSCCRAAVEREGWVKRELAGLAEHLDASTEAAPEHLKGALQRRCAAPGEFAVGWSGRDRLDDLLVAGGAQSARRGGALVGAGSAGMSLGVSMGVAVIGMLALSSPAQAPTPARPLEPARAGLSGTSPLVTTTSGTSGVGRTRALHRDTGANVGPVGSVGSAGPVGSADVVSPASARYRVATEWMRNPL